MSRWVFLLRAAFLGVILCGIGFFIVIAPRPLVHEYGVREPGKGEDAVSYLRAQIRACVASGEATWRGRCFRELGSVISGAFSLPQALKALSAIDEEEGIKQQCHALTHYLGANEFKRTGSLGETTRACSTAIACGEGCFHGAVEGYVGSISGDLSTSTIATTCRREDAHNDTEYFACTHGLGHAFMLVTDNNLPVALKGCDFVHGSLERDYCYAGVFMEDVFSYGSPDHPSTLDPHNPAALCSGLLERYLPACFGAASSFTVQIEKSNYTAVAGFCTQLPVAQQKWCYRAIGADAPLTLSDTAAIARACEVAPRGSSRSYCLAGALDFLAQGTGGDTERILSLCSNVAQGDASACFGIAGQVLESWYPGERDSLCLSAGAKNSTAYLSCVGSVPLPGF